MKTTNKKYNLLKSNIKIELSNSIFSLFGELETLISIFDDLKDETYNTNTKNNLLKLLIPKIQNINHIQKRAHQFLELINEWKK